MIFVSFLYVYKKSTLSWLIYYPIVSVLLATIFTVSTPSIVDNSLIISLITVVAIAAVKILGGRLKDKITEVGCEISGKAYVEGESAGKGYCEGEENKILN